MLFACAQRNLDTHVLMCMRNFSILDILISTGGGFNDKYGNKCWKHIAF